MNPRRHAKDTKITIFASIRIPSRIDQEGAMLTINNISKRYADNLVLDRVGFTVNSGERVGLVGPNGCGKTTLLRIIAGVEPADAGSVACAPAGLTQGYLPQGWEGSPDLSVAELLRRTYPGGGALDELADLERRMAEPGLASAALATLLVTYAEAQERFEALGGYAGMHRASMVRDGLGLADLPPDLPVARLSGGQKTRLGMACLLLAAPDLLLLDEPTNHLDAEALTWLERFLAGYGGAVLIVSHDRAFLDRVATRILEMRRCDDEQPGPQVRSYAGNYGDYVALKAAECERQRAQWKDEQAYVERVAADIQRVKQQGQVNPHSPAAKKAGRKAKAREHKLERYVQSGQRVDKPRQGWGLKLDFDPPANGARVALRVEDVSFGYPTTDGYAARTENQEPRTGQREQRTNDEELRITHHASRITHRVSSIVYRPSSLLLNDVSFEIRHGERVVLVGPNGAGKSTLLKLIAGRLQPDRGQVRLGAGVQLGYLAQEQETLDGHLTILDTLLAATPWSAAESRSFLHRYLFAGDEVFRPVAACSFGERARLALALLVARGCAFLVLDEPINHLDIPARERFEAALDSFGGTILAVAHDRYFLARFAHRVLALRDGALLDYPGGYEEFLVDEGHVRLEDRG
jgi:ATP-binding cassette subfamily F protein 3